MKKMLVLGAVGLLFISVWLVAEDQPKFEPMDQQDIIEWYTAEVSRSMLEDAQMISHIAILTLGLDVGCFDVDIEPTTGRPGWRIDYSNCVDRRTYACKEVDDGQAKDRSE